MALTSRSIGRVRGLPTRRHLAGSGVSTIVLAWCLKLLVGLLSARQRRTLVRLAAVALWVALAVGGIAGSVEHLTGTGPGSGSIDPRPRPPLAPLIFTALGAAGAAALQLGERASGSEAP